MREALDLHIDAVLLDNMSDAQLREAVEIAGGRVLTEASGGIDARRIVPSPPPVWISSPPAG